MKKYLLVLLLLPLLCLVPSEATPKTEVAQYTAPITYRQDHQLVTIMQNLGLDYSKLNLVYGEDSQFSNGDASFTQPNTIYLSPSLEPELINIAISHEYIHYVQTQDVFADTNYLTNLYNYVLYNRMAFYRTDYCPQKNCLSIEQETQAYACTEVVSLRADLETWCDKHLPNRQALLL